MQKFSLKLGGDKVVWIVVILLSIFSILSVYSSTGTLAFRERGGDTEYYLQNQIIIILTGLVILYLVHKINYLYFAKISYILILIILPILLFTLFFGQSINQASRWTTIPIVNVSFQPSDVAKLAIIIFVARMLTKKKEILHDFKKGFLHVVIPVILTCGLILPANFSTGAILFATCFLLMFIGGVKIKHLSLMLLVGTVFITIFILSALAIENKSNKKIEIAQTENISDEPESRHRVGTWTNRINNFLGEGSEEGQYQSIQSKIAIAEGGIIGKMPGNSTQKNYLPNAFNDFIYAIILEEYGLLGGIFILLLYLILFYRGLRISLNAPGTFGSLLSIGVILSICLQALINISVSVGLLPVTGQNLPFISMGGTSMWISCIAIGVLLSVSSATEKTKLMQQKNDTKDE